MLLKKQTVWLLTMLSLVVVLSVYYVTSYPGSQQMADSDNQESEVTGSKSGNNKSDMKVVTGAAGDEEFEMMRIDKMDERSKMRAELTSQVASAESADAKNDLYEKMQNLVDAEAKEKTLETLIKGLDAGYKDALVRSDGREVKITVKTADGKEPTASAANKIIQLVYEEVGPKMVALVEFQTSKN